MLIVPEAESYQQHIKVFIFYWRQVEVQCITNMKILFQPLGVMRTWYSQDTCALRSHSDPCKQSFWSRARNSQESRSFLTASGVGNRSPTWTAAVSWVKVLEFAPQCMPGTLSQLGGLMRLVGGRCKTRCKTIFIL